MKNLKIGVRLAIAFSALLFLLSGIAYLDWSSLAATKAQIDVIVNENNVKIALSNSMLSRLNVVARSTRNYIIYSDKSVKKQHLERIENANTNYDADFERLGSLVRSEKGRQIYAELKELRAEIRPLFKKVVEMVDAEKNIDEVAGFMANSLQPRQDKWFKSIQSMVERQETQNREAVEKMDQNYSLMTELLLGAVLGALAIGSMLAWFITRSITQPIDQAVTLAKRVAAGDLTSRIDVSSKDETGQLLQALKDMNDSLVRIVGEVRGGTDTIASASSQIASGNLDLSSRTEEQASSLEETASSMEELTSTVKQNSENAIQANNLAQSASEAAEKGGAVVTQVVSTMGSINESAKKIVDIIGVIDGIAFQTNILALNAAVEAARAGEQGRGFAVVASEVRNLAQRSAAAAKEIKSLINDSVAKVDVGSKLVNQAGATMEEIVDSVKRVTDIMADITVASQEQSAGIEQINVAVTQMDQVTQQNAALVEEAAAAAESLQAQAGNLLKVVSTFKLDGSHTAAVAPAAKHHDALRMVRSAKPVRHDAHPAKIPAGNRALAKKVVNGPARINEEWDEF